MSKRRRGCAPSVAPGLVLRDFELYSDDSGVAVTVSGDEVRDLFARLAHANGFEEGELLGNESIPAGKPLPCRIVERLPEGCSWISDGSGYVLAKLGRGKTVVGHSFLGDGSSASTDPDYHSVANSTLSHDISSPPRKSARSTRAPGWLRGHSTSPETPGSRHEGRTQAVPIRLHRAGALAASATPETDSRLWVRHVCGHKRRGVVGHFRFGTRKQNEDDESYHKTHMGCSREPFPPMQ